MFPVMVDSDIFNADAVRPKQGCDGGDCASLVADIDKYLKKAVEHTLSIRYAGPVRACLLKNTVKIIGIPARDRIRNLLQ